jgi:hypothetical protein
VCGALDEQAMELSDFGGGNWDEAVVALQEALLTLIDDEREEYEGPETDTGITGTESTATSTSTSTTTTTTTTTATTTATSSSSSSSNTSSSSSSSNTTTQPQAKQKPETARLKKGKELRNHLKEVS